MADTASAQASGGPERMLRVEGLPETAARPRAAGATAFCTTPVEPRRLLAAVHRLCPVD
jgi:hypothetical protein